jgi:hypothetical protein
MTNFDTEILDALRDVREVTIRTEKHPRSAVVIWVVVADDQAFVRSWRGSKGRWYNDLANGGPATLEFAGRQLVVQAIPARDSDSVARVNQEFLRKYHASSHAREMVRSEVLPTTLRLERR